MNKRIKNKWIKALLSGKYKQCRGVLHRSNTDRYCCLGVLARVQGCQEPLSAATLVGKYGKFAKAAKLRNVTQEKLARMNDADRCSFKEIAGYIKNNL